MHGQAQSNMPLQLFQSWGQNNIRKSSFLFKDNDDSFTKLSFVIIIAQILQYILNTINKQIHLNIIFTLHIRTLVKSAYQKIIFLISQPKYMLWVLKRTVSMRRFF